MSKNLWNLGRILYGFPLIITGLFYIFNPRGMVETLTSFIPGELNLIYIAGALWIALGSLITLNIKVRYAGFGLIGLLSAYQVMVHIPAVYTGEHLNVVWFELLRDLSLIGGAFLLVAAESREEEHVPEENRKPQEDWQITTY